jgi:hypothetical protein
VIDPPQILLPKEVLRSGLVVRSTDSQIPELLNPKELVITSHLRLDAIESPKDIGDLPNRLGKNIVHRSLD